MAQLWQIDITGKMFVMITVEIFPRSIKSFMNYSFLISYVKPHPPALAVAQTMPAHHLKWA
jgi:hypothetical protein